MSRRTGVLAQPSHLLDSEEGLVASSPTLPADPGARATGARAVLSPARCSALRQGVGVPGEGPCLVCGLFKLCVMGWAGSLRGGGPERRGLMSMEWNLTVSDLPKATGVSR